MASFPTLKTGAVTQYPASKTVQFRNQTLRFVDGSEQRYRDHARALRHWEIQLSALDEGEMATLEAFFAETQGAYQSFSFTDPWDGSEYPNCTLQSDELPLEWTSERQGRATLFIVENPS